MTPADELRTAAEKLRVLAAAISTPDERDQMFHADGTDVTQGRTGLYDVATTQTTELADYIATMHPGVGTALATLLEGALSSAREASPAHEECTTWCSPETCDLSAALSVARQINATAP